MAQGSVQEKPIVVCTKYKGVFFGYATDTHGATIMLKRARMCLYWARSLHGVLGLAATGPNDECRIGPAVESIELRGVTAVIDVSQEAVRKWEVAPWN